MALTIPHPHLHHPHTRSESLVLWAAGAVVAALAAFVVFQATDNGTESIAPAQTEVATSGISDLVRQAETFQAPVDDFSPESLRGTNPAAASATGQTAASAEGTNPAAASATGQTAASAEVPTATQSGVVSGPR